MSTTGVRCRFSWDHAGIWASAVCAVHCIVLPIALPVLAVTIQNPWIEITILVLAVAAGFLALRSSYRHHRSRLPAVLWTFGMVILVGGHWKVLLEVFSGQPSSHDAGSAAFILTALGGAAIVTAHIVNLALHRRAHAPGYRERSMNTGT